MGVGVDASIVQELWSKIMKKANNLHYIVFNIEDEKKVVVEHEMQIGKSSHQELIEKLPTGEPRFIALNLDFTTTEGGQRSKVLIMLWCPEDCQCKPKMIYAGTFDDVRRLCHGCALALEAHDISEVTYEAIREKLRYVR